MNNTVVNGSGNNQSFNSKPPKKMNWGLIIGIITSFIVIVVGILIFTSSSNNNKKVIKNLNVDLEKFEFTCENNPECNNLNNHIIAIYPYKGKTNIADDTLNAIIIIDDSGKVYFSDQGFKNITQLDGKIDITSITEVIDSDINSSNLIFGADNKYYQITYDGKIEKITNEWDLQKIISLNKSFISGINKSGKYIVYINCNKYKNNLGADKCPTDNTWVKLTPETNSVVDWELKNANQQVYLTKDNKIYSPTLFNFLTFKFESLTFRSQVVNDIEISNDSLVAENVDNMWFWNEDVYGWDSHLIVQMNDNNVRRYTSYGSEYDSINFDKEIKNIYFTNRNDNYIFETSSGYYFTDEVNDTIITKELTTLKKYQNNVRGFTIINGELYVLLSNGNLYKLDEI